jgi:diguanylate cyclase (GGDEF)-like protein
MARRLLRDPVLLLTIGIGIPAVMAAVVVGRLDAAGEAALVTVAMTVGQAAIWQLGRAMRPRARSALALIGFGVALASAAVLSELVIPGSFALYIPVVGLAAAAGARPAAVIGASAVGLYLVPIALRVGPEDPDLLARAVAAAGVCVLVALGARYVVGRLQSSTRDLRSANARERQRVRQIAGIEQVGRLLAAGATGSALDQVMDVLAEQFNYRYVSIYLARDDGFLALGAQRGYAAPIETFDGTYGVVGRVMRLRRAELVADVASDPDYRAANPDVVSEISAPLLVGDELLGIVNVESSSRALDRTDFRLVVAVTDQLAAYVALGRERERLATLAVTDILTGLNNRRYLDDALARLFARRRRQAAPSRESVAAILFDLDHFGTLNKRHGHGAGDVVLRRFGALLASQFRKEDIVGRYGGEEFLVILVGGSLEATERRANAVREAFGFEHGGPEPVTVSAGCSVIDADSVADLPDLLAATDVALSLAKRSGRNRVVSAAV